MTLVVAATGHVGGAHINPAVTLGLWSARRFPSREVPPYIVAQCMGAIAASAALVWLLGPVGNFGATVPAISIGPRVRRRSGLHGDPRHRDHGSREQCTRRAERRAVRHRRDDLRRRAGHGSAHRRQLQPGAITRPGDRRRHLDVALAVLGRADTGRGRRNERLRDHQSDERRRGRQPGDEQHHDSVRADERTCRPPDRT